MVFYIEINGRKFKIRQSIVIGRGAPFTHLEKHFDIARSHACVSVEGGKLFIEDLGSEAGTYVNNLQIEPHRKKRIKLSDDIMIGEHALTITRTEDDRKVKRILNYMGASGASWSLVLLSALLIFVLENEVLGFNKFFPSLSHYASLCFLLILMGQLLRSNKVVQKFFPDTKQIILGGDGLTFLYSNGESFSVKFSKIKKVYDAKKYMVFRAHGKLFRLDQRMHKLICETILKRSQRKLTKTHPQTLLWLGFLLLSATFISLIHYYKLNLYLAGLIVLISSFLFISLGYFLQSKIKKVNLFIYRSNEANRNFALFFLVLFVCGFNFYTPYKERFDNFEELISQCLQTKVQKICEQIDYDELYKRSGNSKSFQVLVKFSCDLKVPRACHYRHIDKRVFE